MVIDEKSLLGMTKIGGRFQITIPEKVREELDLNKGNWVIFTLEDGQVILKKQ
ncbi:MAG: AbrB/MazE/SpoVT family DNA-binding domain-containing protein [Nitrososphaerales archaeon]